MHIINKNLQLCRINKLITHQRENETFGSTPQKNVKFRPQRISGKVLRNLRSRKKGPPHDEIDLDLDDCCCQNYVQSLSIIGIRKDVLVSKYYENIVIISHNKIQVQQMLDN